MSPCRRREDEKGVTLVLMALMVAVLFTIAAFAVDIGGWYARTQQIQAAADAAALAGTVWMPANYAKATAVAQNTTAANGFKNGVNSITVVVSPGNNSRQLKVSITDAAVKRYLSSTAVKGKLTVTRTAIAQYDLPVPLGSPENQFGGGRNGVFLAVNGYCTRRADGDIYSSGFYNNSSPGNSITCAVPYSTASPTGTTSKNLDFRTQGYLYVVDIPPASSGAACTATPPPTTCATTASNVTFQIIDPKLDTNPDATEGDLTLNGPSSCGPSGTTTTPSTTFTVYDADDTPLDDTDNSQVATQTFNSESGVVSAYQDLYTVTANSLAGRYLIRVNTGSAECSGGWSNAFGIRAKVGTTFRTCSTLPGSSLPSGYTFCPQVHGSDAMGVRAAVSGASSSCVGSKVSNSDLCAVFYVAQIDPAQAGRSLALSLFDPGEGAQRLRILGPNGATVAFTYSTIDAGTSLSGSVSATSSGLDVTGGAAASTFNDRKVELIVQLPNASALSVNGGWYKIEYEVPSDASTLTDRTTWGAAVRGSPVHLVS
jgi:Flp pilus assembly protein TadG